MDTTIANVNQAIVVAIPLMIRTESRGTVKHWPVGPSANRPASIAAAAISSEYARQRPHR